MWKPPPRRDYNPKPMDPGQVIVWTNVIPGGWDVPPHYDRETGVYTDGTGRIDPVSYERIGTIWSDGSSPRTWWVVPDGDEVNPVLVRCTGKRQARGAYDGEFYQDSKGDEWREGIRRAENVRKRGVYAVIESEITSRSWSGSGNVRRTLQWHTDPECSLAEGRARWDGNGWAYESEWDVWSIVDVLTGRVHHSTPPPFCSRCVMLEPARELVTA